MPFWMAPDHSLFAPGSVNGLGPKVCSLDTGGPGIGVVVTEETAAELGLELDYAYLRAPTGISHGIGLYVLTLTGDRICAMTRFENSVLPSFGLPRSLPSR